MPPRPHYPPPRKLPGQRRPPTEFHPSGLNYGNYISERITNLLHHRHTVFNLSGPFPYALYGLTRFLLKNFIYFEDNCIEYVCKVKLTSSVRKIIAYLDEQKARRKLDDTYSVAELTVPLPSWERARKFVFIRETVKTNLDSIQPSLDFKDL